VVHIRQPETQFGVVLSPINRPRRAR